MKLVDGCDNPAQARRAVHYRAEAAIGRNRTLVP